MRRTYFWPALQLLSLIVFLALTTYTIREITSERARDAAADQAAKVRQVSDCVDRATQAPTTLRFFNVLATILVNQVAGINDRLEETPDSVDLQARLASASVALSDVRSFRNTYRAQAPRLSECALLADELGVPRPTQIERENE